MAQDPRRESRPHARPEQDHGRAGDRDPRLIATALLAALAAAGCGDDHAPATTGANAPVVAAPPAPPPSHGGVEPYSFALEPAEIDLGVLRPDQDAQFEFAIVNLDARPLKLVNIDGSCDCVSFNWNHREIAPGGRTTVKTDVRARNRGTKLLTVYVQANDRKVTTKQVAIRYRMQSALSFDPPRAEFGRRIVGSASELDVVVSYQIPAESELIALAPSFSAPGPVTFTIDPNPDVAPRAGGLKEVKSKLHLVLDTSRTLPAFESELLFTSDRHVRSGLVVTGTVHDGIYLSTDQLHLGVAEVGETRKGAARLLWTRGDPKVTSIDGQPAGLTARAVREEGVREFRILVELVAAAPGEFEGVIRIATDVSSEPLLLHVKATIR